MQRITPCLWFDKNGEEAAKYYVSVFLGGGKKNSKILDTTYYGPNMHLPKGTVLTVSFILDGQEFMALNGGPAFQFTEAVSFALLCETQKEIDYFWGKLTSGGGKEVQCGWLKDKYGLSWQIVPAILEKMRRDKDPKKVDKVMQAMMKMIKLDIATLKAAYQ